MTIHWILYAFTAAQHQHRTYRIAVPSNDWPIAPYYAKNVYSRILLFVSRYLSVYVKLWSEIRISISNDLNLFLKKRIGRENKHMCIEGMPLCNCSECRVVSNQSRTRKLQRNAQRRNKSSLATFPLLRSTDGSLNPQHHMKNEFSLVNTCSDLKNYYKKTCYCMTFIKWYQLIFMFQNLISIARCFID